MAKTPTSGKGAGRNPPVRTRFRKGQSGNPRGRPKGSRNFRTLVNEELEQELEITENGKVIKLTKRRLVARVLVNEAVRGNPRAWSELFPMIGGPSQDDSVELDEVTAAMLASYLARYRRNDSNEDEEGSA